MNRIKKVFFILTAIMVIMPGTVTAVTAKGDDKAKAIPEADGYVSSKDEVIYGTLSKSGKQKEIYVVNMLDVTKAGEVTDFGDYSSVKNLTDISEIEQSKEMVKIKAPEENSIIREI